jgi:hypothetical protein
LRSMKLQVRLRLLSTAEGGRRTPVSIGYRPLWDNGDRQSDGAVHRHDAAIVDMTPEVLDPGLEAEAVLLVARPEFWHHFRVNDDLVMSEGSNVLGSAKVLGISDND